MKNWKFACSTAAEASMNAPILLRGDIAGNLEKAANLGFQGIEVHMRETTPIDLDLIRNAEQKNGTKVCMIVTGRLNTEGKVNLIDDIPYISESAVKGMKQYIDMAFDLKADIIIGWVRGNLPATGSCNRFLDRLANNLRELSGYAKAKGVRINIEVINRYEINTFTTCRELVDFIDKYELENCYIHLDTFHMNIEEINPVEAINLAGNKLGYIHLADNTRHYPGSGQLDFIKILSALDKIGYAGYLGIECLPVPSGEEAAANGLNFLKSIINSY